MKTFKLQVFMLPAPSFDGSSSDGLQTVEFDAPEGYRLHSWQGVTDREPGDGDGRHMHGVAAVLWQKGEEPTFESEDLQMELTRMLSNV